MNDIEISPAFNQVLEFVNQTNRPVFLTGKAGTGKTTLLRYIRNNTFKQMAVCAPTGVAAINAGGSTLHSFFQFAFGPFVPVLNTAGEIDFSKSLLPVQKYNSQRLSLLRNLELLVIDEISMVRADMLDQVDAALRQARKKWQQPFGGVQVLLIGDMHQLPPVVQAEEWQLLKEVYRSPYFFDSLVVREKPPVYIELEKIYRQQDEKFIEILNMVRNNCLDDQSLGQLNSHFKADLTREDYANGITLTTHNRKADEINSQNLAALSTKEFVFNAKIEETFPEKSYPAEVKLVLKCGCRVMFLRNNPEKNYYNGKTGTISYVAADKIKVRCDEDDEEVVVGQETWQNISYKLDKSTKHVEEEVKGTFTQYPLRLAWAITIHKSQGLTFDKLIIDAAESFSAGQVYVALSRCRTLQGLTLSSKINPGSLLNDKEVLNFSATRNKNGEVGNIFDTARREYMGLLLNDLFDFSVQAAQAKDLSGLLVAFDKRLDKSGKDWTVAFIKSIEDIAEVARKFRAQLGALVLAAKSVETDTALQDRIRKAAAYFGGEVSKCLENLKDCAIRTESIEVSTEIGSLLQGIFENFHLRKVLFSSCSKGFTLQEFVKEKLKVVYPDFRINVYVTAKNTTSGQVKNPVLYKRLLHLRDEICNEEEKPIFMVLSSKTLAELCNYLPDKEEQLLHITGFGHVKVEQYGERFLKVIADFMEEFQLESAADELPSKRRKKKIKKESTSTKPEIKEDTKKHTLRLFSEGLQPGEIAKQRGMALSTIESHLVSFVANGEAELDRLVSADKQRLIRKALDDFEPSQGLGSVKSRLPDDISFSEIRFVLAGKLASA